MREVWIQEDTCIMHVTICDHKVHPQNRRTRGTTRTSECSEALAPHQAQLTYAVAMTPTDAVHTTPGTAYPHAHSHSVALP